MIALDYGLKYPRKADGMILSGPALGFEIPADLLKVGMELVKTKPTMMFPMPLDPYALSHDKNVCDKYVKDPLVFKQGSVKLGVEFTEATARLRQSADKWVVPSLLLIGGDDRLAVAKVNIEFARGVKEKDFQVKVYDGFYHELFNEIGKEKVFSDVDEWLKPRI